MRNERGASLTEVMVALAVMAAALLGGLRSQLTAEAAARDARSHRDALQTVQQALDDWHLDAPPEEQPGSAAAATPAQPAVRWRHVRPDAQTRYRLLEIESAAVPGRPGSRPARLRTILADPDPASLAALLSPAPALLMVPTPGRTARPAHRPQETQSDPAEPNDRERPVSPFDGDGDPVTDCDQEAEGGSLPSPVCPPSAAGGDSGR